MNKKSAENETMEQISIKLPKSLIKRYNEYAKTKSNPRSHFMREALVESPKQTQPLQSTDNK